MGAMERRLILVVEEVYQLLGGRIVLEPSFPANRELVREQLPAPAEIVSPQGEIRACRLNVHLTHFNIRGSTDIDRRWRYVAELNGVAKSEVPIGSALYASCAIWR